MNSLFVAFEGIDASGKETQAKLLAEHLQAPLFSFPNYETPTGQLIKSNLRNEWQPVDLKFGQAGTEEYYAHRNALVLQSLMLTNRMEAAPQIGAYLASGMNVIADRYAASGMVYGASDGLSPTWLSQIHAWLPQPDIYFLLDIPVEESFRRRAVRADRYERNRAKLEDVSSRYRSLFADKQNANDGTYWVTLDGLRPLAEIHQDVLTCVEAYWLQR